MNEHERTQYCSDLDALMSQLTAAQEHEAKLQAEIERLKVRCENHVDYESPADLEIDRLKAENAKLRGVVDRIRSFVREIREPRAWHGETIETKDEYRRGEDYVARKIQLILAESADVLGEK